MSWWVSFRNLVVETAKSALASQIVTTLISKIK